MKDIKEPFLFKKVGTQIYPKVSNDTLVMGMGANFSINKLDRILEWASKTTIVFKGTNEIPLKVGTSYFLPTSDITISTATDLDTGAISNGKNYYIYACDNSGTLVFKISLASTFPAGYDANTSRKIGGFHTICVNVGTIAGHTLTDYLANEIIPMSVWDLKHRCRNSKNEGMRYAPEINKWVQIYLASDDGAGGVASVYNATILDNINWMTFVDRGAKVGMRLLNDDEFQAIAAGSNEETNILGSGDPGNAGGHEDTVNRRMISNGGDEDCAGAMWQWLRDQGFRYDGGSHTHAFTGSALATHQHDITTVAAAGGGTAMLTPATPGALEGGAQTNTNAVDAKTAGTPAGSNASVDPAPAFTWYDLPGAKGSLLRQGTYGDVKLLAGGHWAHGTSCGSRSRAAYYYRWYTLTSIGARLLAEPL